MIPMPRPVPEWVGKNADTKVPPRVRIRVFEKYKGICYLSGRKIGPADKWDTEHIIAIINGGENRETNLAPALKDKHKEKTARDVAEKSKVAKQRSKHFGIKNDKRGFRKRPPGVSAWGRRPDNTKYLD